MAVIDLRAEFAPVIIPNRFPPAAAALIAARMLNKHSIGEITQAIDVLLDVLDLIDGDPDLEANGDDEPTGDEQDCAYVERTTLQNR